jgi:hypothetical protein
MFFGLLDPDPLVRCPDPDPSVVTAKIVKNLDSYLDPDPSVIKKK